MQMKYFLNYVINIKKVSLKDYAWLGRPKTSSTTEIITAVKAGLQNDQQSFKDTACSKAISEGSIQTF